MATDWEGGRRSPPPPREPGQMSMFDGPGRDTLAEARAELFERLREGSQCPCCDQNAKLYRRRLTATPVRSLIGLYRMYQVGFGHMPTVAKTWVAELAHQGGYVTLAGYWQLMEEELERRPDGGRSGWWRVTPLGVDFIHRRARVPRFAETYNGEVRSLTGDPIGVVEALGTQFDLRELMGWPLEESA